MVQGRLFGSQPAVSLGVDSPQLSPGRGGLCHATPRQDLASLRPRQGKPPLSPKPEHSAAQLHPPEKENPGANRFFPYGGWGCGGGDELDGVGEEDCLCNFVNTRGQH